MNPNRRFPSTTPPHLSLRTLGLAALLALAASPASAAAANGTEDRLLDDYSDTTRNRRGIARLVIDDKTAGGKSRATPKCERGVLKPLREIDLHAHLHRYHPPPTPLRRAAGRRGFPT